MAPLWGAPWTDAAGKSAFTDPSWSSLLQWQKKFVDAIGYDKLRRFTSGAGDSEFAATNLFETGKLAMNLDGEYRTAFITDEHPELKFATAPFPTADDQASRFGAGYVTGNSLGIPRNRRLHREQRRPERLAEPAPPDFVLLDRHHRPEGQHPTDIPGADHEHQQHQRPAAADAEHPVMQPEAQRVAP